MILKFARYVIHQWHVSYVPGEGYWPVTPLDAAYQDQLQDIFTASRGRLTFIIDY